MTVVSVNVGLPTHVAWKGQVVKTGIFKQPVEGRVAVRTLNLEGDAQADLSVHGGAGKAVYVYPEEHYDYWRRELPDLEFSSGMFGENLTIQGLSEHEVNIGDSFRIGSAEFRVTGPRTPCYKLGIRFGRAEIVKRFLLSERSGFYFQVVSEGDVGSGDAIELSSRDGGEVTVADIVRLYAGDKENLALLRRAVQVKALPESWQRHFQHRIEKLEAQPRQSKDGG